MKQHFQNVKLSIANTKSTPISLGKPVCFIKDYANKAYQRSTCKACRRPSQVLTKAIGAALLALHED